LDPCLFGLLDLASRKDACLALREKRQAAGKFDSLMDKNLHR
jgi:hypothetical protein